MSEGPLELRSLQGVGWAPLADAFNAAFSDYAVPMAITPDGLASMQQRRGYSAELSFGAFAGEQLVGFALTCAEGERIYNSGTGVTPARRGGGLARRLVEQVIAAASARRYVLEVIDRNAPAIALYRRLGFVEQRGLQCWTWAGAAPAAPLPLLMSSAGSAASALGSLAADFAADFDLEPSWQNSLASIQRAAEPHLVVGDERGFAVVFSGSGSSSGTGSSDVPLLCVRRAARRGGHGARLLASASAHCGRPLRLINLDERAAEVAAFLAAAGATRTVRQLEMIRPLP
jgi:GNAT superfamily N-acetyltransferase